MTARWDASPVRMQTNFKNVRRVFSTDVLKREDI
jgi:hypothetical protein